MDLILGEYFLTLLPLQQNTEQTVAVTSALCDQIQVALLEHSENEIKLIELISTTKVNIVPHVDSFSR